MNKIILYVPNYLYICMTLIYINKSEPLKKIPHNGPRPAEPFCWAEVYSLPQELEKAHVAVYFSGSWYNIRKLYGTCNMVRKTTIIIKRFFTSFELHYRYCRVMNNKDTNSISILTPQSQCSHQIKNQKTINQYSCEKCTFINTSVDTAEISGNIQTRLALRVEF